MKATTSESTKNKCHDKQSQLFIQYRCEESDEAASKKYIKLSIVASIIVLIAMLMILGIHYLEKKQKIDNYEYDILTSTITDYTVKLDITDDIYQSFLNDPHELEKRRNQNK